MLIGLLYTSLEHCLYLIRCYPRIYKELLPLNNSNKFSSNIMNNEQRDQVLSVGYHTSWAGFPVLQFFTNVDTGKH